MTTKTLTPAIATHPGEILLDEIIANNFSQIDFAKMIGYSRTQLNEIIKGKRNINADFALLLEKALGIDAEYWMEAQKNYDLDKARIKKLEQVVALLYTYHQTMTKEIQGLKAELKNEKE